jgi:replicative DNA helicase
MIRKFKDIQESLIEMREKGNPRGENTGFACLDEFYSVKEGSYTFILAPPYHGKSEFAFEIAFAQAEKYGKKTLIYSPETGSTEDIYAEFIHKYTGRPFYKSIPGSVDDKQFYNAVNYIDEMFSIVDSDEKAYGFNDLINLVRDEKIILTDPYNELKHDMSLSTQIDKIYILKISAVIYGGIVKSIKNIGY